MPEISVAGLRLAYQECGGDGRPLLLVHGFTGNRNDFREHYAALCTMGRTISYDHRGHGESENAGAAAAYGFARLAEDLKEVVDALDLTEIDLLGHSMGGMVALRYALAHPGDVASLILMDTSARAPDGFQRFIFEAGGGLAIAEGMDRLAEIASSFAREDPNRPAASMAFERRIGTEAYWQRHRDRMRAMDPYAFGVLGLEICDQAPLTERLSEITCPTTIIVGEQDGPFLQPSEEMEAAIPGARRVVIPDAAHSPQLENPSAWLAAMRDHLRWARRTI